MGAVIVFNPERRIFLPDQEINSSQKLFIGRFRKAKIKWRIISHEIGQPRLSFRVRAFRPESKAPFSDEN